MKMDGYRAYKYYAAIKLHFTSPKYDVFKMKGRVRCSPEKFQSRNDHYLFEKLGGRFSADKDYVQYIAANFMYRNPNVIYGAQEAEQNYKEYIRRKQSITKVFQDDLHTIIKSGAKYEFTGPKIPKVIQLWLSDKITLETMVILNDFDGIVDKLRQNQQISLLYDAELLRIEKAKGFVKYNSSRVMSAYQEFLEDIKGNTNG